MITGYVRDELPWVLMTLPGRGGSPVRIEFIVDTGFTGELAIPLSLLQQLDAVYSHEHPILLAGGAMERRPFYEIVIEWEDEQERLTEVTALDGGNPLLGNGFLRDNLLQIEMAEGGEVTIEPF
jgi:predicted aspartyl protease